MAQRLNKTLVVALTLAGMAAMVVGGALLIIYLPAKDPGPILDQAHEYEKKGNYEEARAAYLEAAKAARRVRPDNKHSGKANEYMIQAGDMAFQGGRIGDAINIWKGVLREDRQNETAQLRLLGLYLDNYRLSGAADWAGVEGEARQLVQMNKDKPNRKGLAALGLALVKQRKPEKTAEGEKDLKAAVDGDKSDPEAAEYLASFYVQDAEHLLFGPDAETTHKQADARLAEAQKVYDELIAHLPADPKAAATAWRYRGMCYLELRNLAWSRRALLQKGKAIADSEADVAKQLADADEETLKSLKKAAASDPQDEKCRTDIGLYWAAKPSLETDEAKQKTELAGFRDKAKEAYKEAKKLAPDEFEAYLALSMLYRQLGDIAAAGDVLEERLALGPQRGTWRERRSRAGLAQLRQQVFDIRLTQAQAEHDREARQKLLTKLEKLRAEYLNDAEGGETNPQVKYMQSRLLMLNEKYPEAIKLLEEANAASGKDANPDIKFKLAQLYDQTHSPGKAQELLLELSKTPGGSSNDLVWRMLAVVQLELGNGDQALASAEHARLLNPQSEDVLKVLRVVQDALHNTDAVNSLNKQLGTPDDPNAKLIQEAVALLRSPKPGEAPTPADQEKAKAKLHQVLAADPSSYPALRLLALIVSPQKDDAEDVKAQKIAELKTALDAGLAAAQKKLAAVPSPTTRPIDEETKTYCTRLAETIRKLSVFTVPATSLDERVKKLEEIIQQEPDAYEKAVNLAGLYSSVGKIAEALEQMKKAMELRPKDVDVVENTFSMALGSKATWPVADECIKRLKDLGTSQAGLRLHRGRLALAKAEIAQQENNAAEVRAQAAVAKEELEASLKEFPSDADACARLGQALGLLGQLDTAQQWLGKSLQLNPKNRAATLLMYQMAMLRRDETQRQVWLRRLREVWPDNDYVRREDEAAQDANDPQAGIARRENVAKSKPKDVNNLLVLAALYGRTKQADKANATYEQCRQIEPDNLYAIGSYAAFLREKDPPDPAAAEQMLQQAQVQLKDAGDKARVQLMLAGHYESLLPRGVANTPTPENVKALENVKATYEAAAKIKESPEVLVDIAGFYARVGEPREAEAKLRRSIALTDTAEQAELNRRIRRELIQLLMNAPEDRYGEIEAEIKAYGSKFNDGFAQLTHCDLALATGRLPEALEDMNTYVNKMPQEALGFFKRGYVQYQRGAIDKAIEDLNKAVATDPRGLNYQHRLLLAQCLVASNQTDVAIAQLNAIVQDDPNASTVVRQLADLYAGLKQWTPAEALLLPRARDLKDPNRLSWMGMLTSLYNLQGDGARAIAAARDAAEAGNYRSALLDILAGLSMRANQPRQFIDFVTQKVPAEAQKQPLVQLRLAECYAAAKDMPKALEIYDQLLTAAGGKFADVLPIVSSLSQAAGKDGVAWLAQRQAAKPDDRSLRFGVGVSQIQANDQESGMKALYALLAETTGTDDQSKSEKIQLLRFMSITEHAHKDLPAARKLYEQLLEVDPSNSQASNNLAYLLMTEFKDLPKAQALAETAVHNLPRTASSQDRAVLLDTLGWSLVQTGNLDAGIARLRQAASLAQSGTEAYDYVVAGIYYHTAEGYFRRSQAQGSRTAESDRSEAVVACRNAWRWLKTADKTDPDHMREALQAVAGKLKIELEQKAPASQPAKTT